MNIVIKILVFSGIITDSFYMLWKWLTAYLFYNSMIVLNINSIGEAIPEIVMLSLICIGVAYMIAEFIVEEM